MNRKHPPSRPRYIAFVAASVDGRISLSGKHPPDWTSKEDWRFFQKSLSRIDAVVVGRNTYQSAADRLRQRNTFVLSSRPKTLTRRGTVTFVNPTNVNLPKLLEGYASVAVLGGGAVYRFMLESKLLDEIFITVEPLIFGRGKEMFVGGTRMTRQRAAVAPKTEGMTRQRAAVAPKTEGMTRQRAAVAPKTEGMTRQRAAVAPKTEGMTRVSLLSAKRLNRSGTLLLHYQINHQQP